MNTDIPLLSAVLALLPMIGTLSAADLPSRDNPAPSAKPNIVLIVADDLGWTDLHCFGSGYYQTPNINRLCAQGMKFTSAYACPNCAPTRAQLMSGQYPPRTGVYTVASGARGRAENRKLIPVKNNTTLAPAVVTLAETLKSAGYTTSHLGKWHLGRPGVAGPREQGFDDNVGGNQTGQPAGGYFSPYHNHQLPDGPKGENLTDRLSREAVDLIRRHRAGPFFIYMPFYAVHQPLQAKPDVTRKYEQIKPIRGHHNPTYAAMIQTMDEGVGRILAALDEFQLAQRTLVIFISDNGGVGGYASIGLPNNANITDNAPLRGGKGCLYEGGVRVPMIVRWPGVTRPGAVCGTPVDVIDFYPTLVRIAGATLPARQPLDGVDITPLFQGHTISPRALYWHFPGYLEAYGPGNWRTTPAGAIRDGDFKLLEFFEDHHVELYNLSDDLSEERDLAASNPEKAHELQAKLEAWRQSMHAPMPEPKE